MSAYQAIGEPNIVNASLSTENSPIPKPGKDNFEILNIVGFLSGDHVGA